MSLEYFDFDAIQLKKAKVKFGHVVLRIRGSSSNEKSEGHDVWDSLIDNTNWNKTNRGTEYVFEGGTEIVDWEGIHDGGSFKPYGKPIKKHPGEDTDEGPFDKWFPPGS